MASICWALLLLLCLVQLHPLATSRAHDDGNPTHHHTPSSCYPDQANALLKLKQSFMFHSYDPQIDLPDSITTLPSWQAGTNCCLWEGVGCSNSSGHVTSLNLSGFGLYSNGVDPVLFNLTSLRLLDLSMNNFGGDSYKIASVGFERLALLTNLNLACSSISGQVPVGISKLTHLVSLDLSSCYIDDFDSDSRGTDNFLQVWEPNFQTLVANLSNLRELYLDDTSIPSSAQDCFRALAKSVPHLRVLSLEGCSLQGHIDPSLSRLHSLAMINLSDNDDITPGPFPEFFMNFLNLRVLQLSNINLKGPFPRGVFQSKNLRVLELSENPKLSGHIPRFSDATSLDTLMVDGTNFSYVRSSYFSNFTALTELGLDGKIISGDFLSSFGMVPSLRKLILTGLNLPSELESVFSWFEGIKNLRSLKFQYCDLSMTVPSSIRKFKSLTSLVIFNSNITTQTLSAVTNIRKLKFFTIDNCVDCLLGQLPPAIGNLTSLERLDIFDCRLSGSIPHEVGAVKKLISLGLPETGLSGRIPSSFGNLTQLTGLWLVGNYLNGEIPTSLFTLPALQYLDLSHNQLSGPIHEFDGASSRLKIVYLQMNELTGQIPQSLLVLPNLTHLDIYRNNLTGSVDLESSLWRCDVQTIDLHGNKIEGQLPRALHNCTNLEVLDLGRNQIADTFPSWLGRLLNLRVLVLRSNQFHGSIGYLEDEKSGEQFSSLQIIDLASNNFSGNLHSQWFGILKSMEKYNNTGHIIDHPNGGFYQDSVTISYKGSFMTFDRILTTLTAIDISDNALEGSIPVLVGNLVSLHVLNMSHNAFSGEIPPQLGGITALESLDLSSNMLSGEIPQELTNLSFLSVLNLRNNRLDGRIPQSPQFMTFQNSSFDGNAGLCGPPLSKQCGNPDTKSKENLKSSSGSVDVVLFLCVGVGFGVGFAAAILVKQDWISKWFHTLKIL
ncbi:unnamed protein product [Urochloa humidicola]